MKFQSPDAQPPREDSKSWLPHPAESLGVRIAEINLAEFGELVSLYQDRLYHTVLRLVGNADDARDVVQESFLRAYQFRYSFQGGSLFFTWLYRIAINSIISLKRKQRRQQPGAIQRAIVDPLDSSHASQPSDAMEMAEQERRVHDALGKLSIEHREVLVMKDMEDMKYENMAEILGVPVGTIRSRLHRARLKLRHILTQK
jgi:RNA polymerase sigma-70 factor (ECF subfamily)